jgi:hypothetical protein
MPDCHQPFVSDLRRSVHQCDRKELTRVALRLHRNTLAITPRALIPTKTDLAKCFFVLSFSSTFARNRLTKLNSTTLVEGTSPTREPARIKMKLGNLERASSGGEIAEVVRQARMV